MTTDVWSVLVASPCRSRYHPGSPGSRKTRPRVEGERGRVSETVAITSAVLPQAPVAGARRDRAAWQRSGGHYPEWALAAGSGLRAPCAARPPAARAGASPASPSTSLR